MCERSNRPRGRSDGAVLVDDARVLDRHLPAGEVDQPRAERSVRLEERGLGSGRDPVGRGGAGVDSVTRPSDSGRPCGMMSRSVAKLMIASASATPNQRTSSNS